MRHPTWTVLVCLAFATPALAQDAAESADTFLDIMVPPLTLRTQADTGELIELEISNTGFLELQIGDEVQLPDGSEAQLRLGTSAIGIAGSGPATTVSVVEATPDRQTVLLNGTKLSFRDGTLVDLSTTSTGLAWAAIQYGSLNVYGPEAGDGGAIRLLAADLPRKFDVSLTKGQTLNLRVVDGKGTFTALAGKIELVDGDGATMPIEEGQSVPADGKLPGMETTLTVQEVASEPITVQRGGEGGKIEQIGQASQEGQPVTLDLAPSDLVTMGEGARAEVKVGGSFVKLTEFTTFAVNAIQPEIASVNVLGVDLELDTVTIIEVAYGSLYVDVQQGTIRAVADSGAAIQNFFIQLPSGKTVSVEVPAGGSFEVELAADGSLSFTNVGTTSVTVGGVVVAAAAPGEDPTPMSSDSVAAFDNEGVTGTEGTVVTEEGSSAPATGSPTGSTDPGAPIPGTKVNEDPISPGIGGSGS